jgi:hypothetical protein
MTFRQFSLLRIMGEHTKSYGGRLLAGFVILGLLVISAPAQGGDQKSPKSVDRSRSRASIRDRAPNSQKLLPLGEQREVIAYAGDYEIALMSADADGAGFSLLRLPGWLIFLILFVVYFTSAAGIPNVVLFLPII